MERNGSVVKSLHTLITCSYSPPPGPAGTALLRRNHAPSPLKDGYTQREIESERAGIQAQAAHTTTHSARAATLDLNLFTSLMSLLSRAL